MRGTPVFGHRLTTANARIRRPSPRPGAVRAPAQDLRVGATAGRRGPLRRTEAERLTCLFQPRAGLLAAALAAISFVLGACGSDAETLTVYSGRSKSLVGPVLDDFSESTGIETRVRYASSPGIAAIILEEGDNSPADVVFLQDPGSLGALSEASVLAPLPDRLLSKVDRRFRARNGEWVGVSGRARTVVYNTSRVDPANDLPDSILGFTDPKWKGRIGWAPANGSFQAFVTALRVQLGDEAARDWLERTIANDPTEYPNNTTIVRAAATGEIDVGFVNHYYVERLREEEGQGFGARNHFTGNGDPGALVLVAGAGVLETSDKRASAERFIDFLTSADAQDYFAKTPKEYPLIDGIDPIGDVVSLDRLDPPDVDLSSLADLEGTLRMLREVGALP